uniref:Uncharacterized protein n=1 Tax=Arion vulgaris TaxID=1028688 RepID=A0A0B7AW06_9EUPU
MQTTNDTSSYGRRGMFAECILEAILACASILFEQLSFYGDVFVIYSVLWRA